MHILSEALHEHSTGHGEAAPWEYYLPKRHTPQRKAGRTWGRVAALCDQWETDTVGPLCTAPVHSMCLVANLTSISRPLRWRRRYCQAVFRSRHIGLSHRLRRHHASHPAGNAPESPVGTRGARLPVFRRESGRDGPSFLPTSKTPLHEGHAWGVSSIMKTSLTGKMSV